MTTPVSPSRTAAVQEFLAAIDRLVARETRSDPARLAEQADNISAGGLPAGLGTPRRPPALAPLSDVVRHDDEQPDARWIVARERTVLGWIRLSAGLLVAGFLVAFGAMPVPPAVGSVLGAVLMLAAAAAGVAALVDR